MAGRAARSCEQRDAGAALIAQGKTEDEAAFLQKHMTQSLAAFERVDADADQLRGFGGGGAPR